MRIIIPAYEPDNKLLSLIDDIKLNINYDIILVNDGSSKKASEIFQTAKEKGCTILTHSKNQGKGAALKTAFYYLLQIKENSGIVCADCDGQHTWQDIKKIADAIPTHKNSIILGCREFVGPVPFKSLVGNKITRGIFTVISGSKITDTQTGLRGFSPDMLSWLVDLKGNHYEYEMNQLLQAKSTGYQFFCIPIETVYENKNEDSHFHPITDSIRIYLPILKFSLSSIFCGVIDFVLLLLFNQITNILLISVILSRIISSTCNYLLNKNIVFEAKEQNHYISFIKYFSLVAVILICNFLLLSFFTKVAGISLIIGKLLTELILFVASYFIQQQFIFFHKNKIG